MWICHTSNQTKKIKSGETSYFAVWQKDFYFLMLALWVSTSTPLEICTNGHFVQYWTDWSMLGILWQILQDILLHRVKKTTTKTPKPKSLRQVIWAKNSDAEIVEIYPAFSLLWPWASPVDFSWSRHLAMDWPLLQCLTLKQLSYWFQWDDSVMKSSIWVSVHRIRDYNATMHMLKFRHMFKLTCAELCLVPQL